MIYAHSTLSIKYRAYAHNRKGGKTMKQIKAMIFTYIQENHITNENLIKLLFGIAKEFKTAKEGKTNPVILLSLMNNIDTFYDILQDILQQCVLEYYTDNENAYKNTLKYIYNTYFKQGQKQKQIQYYKNISQKTIPTITITLITDSQKNYWQELENRTYNNLQKYGRCFCGGRQKEQTIEKLKKLELI